MGGLANLETLSVALREVRNLIHAGALLALTAPTFPSDVLREPAPAPTPTESLRLR